MTGLLTLSLLLALLSGCSKVTETPVDTDEPQETDEMEPLDPPENRWDGVFTVNYTTDASLNPFVGTNFYNIQLFGLLYESLFELDGNLVPQKVLCEDYETQDGITYTIKVLSGVKFHNGDSLTAQDVAYSINTARLSTKYASRLSCIDSAVSEGGQVLTITLSSANYSLPALLDIPIVQYGTGENNRPIGSGPYVMGEDRLTAYTGYRDYSSLPLRTIILTKLEPDELAEAFALGNVNLLGYNILGATKLNINMVHETRSFDTTELLYLGFNMGGSVTSSSNIRRAISYLVDRESICTNIYSGMAQNAPLVLNPVLSYYDESWESGTGYSRESFYEIVESLGMEDSNHDGFLEYNGSSFTLKLIVNEDNANKLSVAQKIATELNNMGFKVSLNVLSWDDYKEALAQGDFSMYVGQVKLQADFDLSELLKPGGAVNYGGVSDLSLSGYIDSFLSAADDTAKEDAAEKLCDYVKETAPIVPIAYGRYSVYTRIGELTGLEPSQSNIYRNIAGWSLAGQ
jgi:peptide/nickel transport system substrate-binding protein